MEILHNGTWSAICDDYWGYSEAAVACHMLGFATAVRAYIRLVNFSKPLEICTELVYSKPLKFLVNYWVNPSKTSSKTFLFFQATLFSILVIPFSSNLQ